MARLNEAEPGAESIECLRRRFLRQNRDLIRANAAQSAKIRALETQISNLLADNLSHRDTIIHLQADLDESRYYAVVDNVQAIQKQLEEKMRECSSIVSMLGEVEKKAKRNGHSAQHAARSPHPREWRTRATLSEVLETQPGHLPTIVEGKHYPRRTLDSVEINNIVEASSHPSESPEAYSIPRLNDPETLRQEPGVERSQQQDAESRDTGLLSVNFETRKRRRETYVRPDAPGAADLSSSAGHEVPFLKTPERLMGKPIRATRKRRLSSQQSIDGARSENEDFSFTKKEVQDTQRRAERVVAEENIPQQSILDKKPDLPATVAVQRLESPQRLALSSKATNMSPQKTVPRNAAHLGKKEVLNEDKLDRLDVDGNDILIIAPPETRNDSNIADIDLENMKHEPRTPAFADLNSPTSTQPSELRAESRDTPPPGGFSHTHSTTDHSAGGARPSRRARAQVNYAEPNLISKMRRPTKEFAPAVAEDKRQSSEPEVIQESQQGVRVVMIKREQDSGAEWRPATSASTQELSRPEPQSPLQPRQDEEGSRSKEVAHFTTRSRRQSVLTRQPEMVKIEDVEGLEKGVEALDIYDVKISSPMLQEGTVPSSKNAAEQANFILTNSQEKASTSQVRTSSTKRQSSLSSSRTAAKAGMRPSSSLRPAVAPSSSNARTASTAAGQRTTSTSSTDRTGKLMSVDRDLATGGRRRSMML